MKTGMTGGFSGGDTVRVKGCQPSRAVRHQKRK